MTPVFADAWVEEDFEMLRLYLEAPCDASCNEDQEEVSLNIFSAGNTCPMSGK
jgi:hypothetical protein